MKNLGLGVLSFLILSCTKTPTNSAPPSPEALASRGRAVYMSTCVACHNSDPKKSGPLGPEIYGSSLELLDARVINGTYPDGYKPKRDTHAMVPIPRLKNDLPAIHAFLNLQN